MALGDDTTQENIDGDRKPPLCIDCAVHLLDWNGRAVCGLVIRPFGANRPRSFVSRIEDLDPDTGCDSCRVEHLGGEYLNHLFGRGR